MIHVILMSKLNLNFVRLILPQNDFINNKISDSVTISKPIYKYS